MSVATDFRAWLLTNSTLTKYVGDRICQLYVQVPKGLPYVMFRRSGRASGLDGSMDLDGETGIDVTTLDVEICGERKHDVDTIADTIRDAVNGFPFSAATRTWNNRTIQRAEVTDANDDYEFMPPASDQIERQTALIIEVISDG